MSRDVRCVKSVCIRTYSGQYFPAFRLNTERFSVFSPNAGKYGTRITLHTDTFHAVVLSFKRFICEENSGTFIQYEKG